MQTIQIKGMSCQHCVQSVTEALEKLNGLQNIRVDLEHGQASFENSGNLDEQTIKNTIISIGFEAV